MRVPRFIVASFDCPTRRLERGLWIGASHRGTVAPPRPYPGDIRRKLSLQAKQGKCPLPRLGPTGRLPAYAEFLRAPPGVHYPQGRLVFWDRGYVGGFIPQTPWIGVVRQCSTELAGNLLDGSGGEQLKDPVHYPAVVDTRRHIYKNAGCEQFKEHMSWQTRSAWGLWVRT